MPKREFAVRRAFFAHRFGLSFKLLDDQPCKTKRRAKNARRTLKRTRMPKLTKKTAGGQHATFPSYEEDVFERELTAAHRRAKELADRINSSPGGQQEVVLEAVEELQTALEELTVTEEELRNQNEELLAARLEVEAERLRYEDLFQSAPDGYIVTDQHGAILKANRVAAAMLGLEPRFLTGKPLISYVDDANRTELRNKLLELAGSESSDSRKLDLRIRPRGIQPFDASLR